MGVALFCNVGLRVQVKEPHLFLGISCLIFYLYQVVAIYHPGFGSLNLKLYSHFRLDLTF